MVVKVWSRFLATRQIKGKPRWWKDVVGGVDVSRTGAL
jgi:hypothetical protein